MILRVCDSSDVKDESKFPGSRTLYRLHSRNRAVSIPMATRWRAGVAGASVTALSHETRSQVFSGALIKKFLSVMRTE